MIWGLVVGGYLVAGLAGWWLIEEAVLKSDGEVTMDDRWFASSLVLAGPIGLLVGTLMFVSATWPGDGPVRTRRG